MDSIDSHDELVTLSKLATKLGKEIKVAFRVNPDVSANAHPKLATGLKISKFGIPGNEIVDTYREAKGLPGIKPVGIHCHIGSGILEDCAVTETVNKMMDLVGQISDFIDLEFVDIGGGFGIPYQKDVNVPTPQDWADAIIPTFKARCKTARHIAGTARRARPLYRGGQHGAADAREHRQEGLRQFRGRRRRL